MNCPFPTVFSTKVHTTALSQGLLRHVSLLMDQYKALVERANSGNQDDISRTYQSISKLEPVAKLVQRLEDKSNVNTPSPYMPFCPVYCSC